MGSGLASINSYKIVHFGTFCAKIQALGEARFRSPVLPSCALLTGRAWETEDTSAT